MTRRLLGFALVLLFVGCSDPARPLQPTAPDAIPEASFDGPALRSSFLDATGWLRAPALEAPDGATRVGMLVTLDADEATPPRFEARGRDAEGNVGPWQPLEITWRENTMFVARVDLTSVAERAELRLPRADAERVVHLTWSAVVPEPPRLDLPTNGSGEVGRTTSPLRSELVDFGVQPRSAWGARATRCADLNTTKTRMAIHHTVTAGMGDPTGILRGIQAYHMDSNGWCDVGYHFLMSIDGRMWEGRELNFLGAHVANNNTGNIGVSFMGCFHTSSCSSLPPNQPPDVMVQNAARLVSELGRLYGIEPNATTVLGHRDHPGASTACPGDHLYARLDEIRAGMPIDYAAQWVAQSFPLASMPFELAGNEEVEGTIEMRNVGAATWRPGEVFLGTTEPRDGPSAIAADDWIDDHRAATVDRDVAPGETGTFRFSVRAPNVVGDYPQFFNLVREGVAWFSDQGGPRDDQLQVRVTTTSVTEMPDAGPPARPDAGVSDDAGVTIEEDAGSTMRPTVKKSGCGCTTMGDPRGAAFFALALFALRRRRLG
ncbi:MAG: N-acetylmuramoyl-L-alanine amidase [Polyangiales bacterium]